MYLEKLRQFQPVAMQILENSLVNNQLSHAYLFSGAKGTLTKEAAILLAQTMVCEDKNHVFACEMCNTCRRVRESSYTDVILIDGHQRNIKKDEILQLQSRFLQTSLEKAGKKVYIIHHVENATNEALNSLLKFLEEPSSSDMLAILTSENQDQLLPTILSRTQVIPFLSQAATQIEPLLKEDIQDKLSRYLISFMVSDLDSAIDLANSEQFTTTLETFKEFITRAQDDVLGASIYLQKQGFNFKSKEIKQTIELFCQISYIFFKESAYQNTLDVDWWDEAIHNKNLQKFNLYAMQIFNEGKDKIQTNANMNLLVDQMMFALTTNKTRRISDERINKQTRV